MQLGRQDLAGKTGTTNESVDAWFCGFNAAMVGVAWIGYDQPRTLGPQETGAAAALPIWMAFMSKALKGVPETPLKPPEGIVVARVNPETGMREADGAGIPEYFYSEFTPRRDETAAAQAKESPREIRNQLF
jgi:penicillin-binding protein 1A